MKTLTTLLVLMTLNLLCSSADGAEKRGTTGGSAVAAQAINALGLDLLTKGMPAKDNALLSPYSIQTALAMTFAGASGDTRSEMAKVLHFSGDEAALHQSFAALRTALEAAAQVRPSSGDPFTLTVANRLFGQKGFIFREPFLALAQGTYLAPLQQMDFKSNPSGAAREINRWVEQQTRDRIRDLISPSGLNDATRLVLVNAIYMKAPWANEFAAHNTQPRPFRVGGGAAVDVPMMALTARLGHSRHKGFTAVTLPYRGGDIQFLVLLPEATNSLAALEAALSPRLLADCSKSETVEVMLWLPKFKLEPPSMPLAKALQSLGMKTAFDLPRGSADFDRMAPRLPDRYLYISEVLHKTFLALDEKGTEAAAATAVMMVGASAIIEKPKPVEVRVDHPFLFAIQHRTSGACLFLGRIQDPR